MLLRIVLGIAVAYMSFAASVIAHDRWGDTRRVTTADVGIATTIVCSAAAEGRLFYDTDAGALGTLDDGLLCVCGNDVLQGYVWRDINTPTAELAGATTTDCGT